MSGDPNDTYYFKLQKSEDEDMADLAVTLGAISHFFNYVEVEIEKHPPSENLDRPATSIKAIFNLPTSGILNHIIIEAEKDFSHFRHEKEETKPIYRLQIDTTIKIKNSELKSSRMEIKELRGALGIFGLETISPNSNIAYFIQSVLLVVLASKEFQPPLRFITSRMESHLSFGLFDGTALFEINFEDLDTDQPILNIKIYKPFDYRASKILREIIEFFGFL
ncbi:hypothetical protein DRN43_00575 [Thermococci archaeon]|nr:MAG: hypothetical protein DRN43_00575 [Thermococci archaeon]